MPFNVSDRGYSGVLAMGLICLISVSGWSPAACESPPAQEPAQAMSSDPSVRTVRQAISLIREIRDLEAYAWIVSSLSKRLFPLDPDAGLLGMESAWDATRSMIEKTEEVKVMARRLRLSRARGAQPSGSSAPRSRRDAEEAVYHVIQTMDSGCALCRKVATDFASIDPVRRERLFLYVRTLVDAQSDQAAIRQAIRSGSSGGTQSCATATSPVSGRSHEGMELGALCVDWFPVDPDEAIRNAEAIPDPVARSWTLSRMARTAPKSDPALARQLAHKALEAAALIDAPEARIRLTVIAAKAMASADHAAGKDLLGHAVRMVQDVVDPWDKARLTALLVHEWSGLDRQAARKLVYSIPDGFPDAKAQAHLSMANSSDCRGMRDVETAHRLAQMCEDHYVRDSIVARCAELTADCDPDRAELFASGIESRGVRSRTMACVMVSRACRGGAVKVFDAMRIHDPLRPSTITAWAYARIADCVRVNNPSLALKCCRLGLKATGLLGAATNDRICLGLPRTPIRGRSACRPMAGPQGSTQTGDSQNHRAGTPTCSRGGAGSQYRSSRLEKKPNHSSAGKSRDKSSTVDAVGTLSLLDLAAAEAVVRELPDDLHKVSVLVEMAQRHAPLDRDTSAALFRRSLDALETIKAGPRLPRDQHFARIVGLWADSDPGHAAGICRRGLAKAMERSPQGVTRRCCVFAPE